MKIAGLMFLLLAAGVASAQTNQACRNPVRVFGANARVDLTPLFEWWARQPLPGTNHPLTLATNASLSANTATNASTAPESDRPLSSWYRISGTKVATLGTSWLVDAVIYTSPTVRASDRIILNHPPAVEEQTYQNLRAQLAQAIQQLTNAQHAYQVSTNAEQKDEAKVREYRRSLNKVAPTSANNYERRAAEKHAEAAAALKQQQQAEAARDQILKQLKTIPSINGVYHIDWFALAAGSSKQGQAIYDLGLVSPSPP